MDFSQYIKHDDPKNNILIHSQEQKSYIPHLHDPFLRRYHIIKILANSFFLALSIWSLRLLSENLMRVNFKRLSPWIQLTPSTIYFTLSIKEKFYNEAHRHLLTRGHLQKQFEKEHYKDSQFWH